MICGRFFGTNDLTVYSYSHCAFCQFSLLMNIYCFHRLHKKLKVNSTEVLKKEVCHLFRCLSLLNYVGAIAFFE